MKVVRQRIDAKANLEAPEVSPVANNPSEDAGIGGRTCIAARETVTASQNGRHLLTLPIGDGVGGSLLCKNC